MIKDLVDIKETDTLDDLRDRLARAIGWPEPVPVGAFHRAVNDPAFGAALLVSRNVPGFLQPLLDDPRNRAFEPEVPQGRSYSSAELVGRAAKALVGWGKAGFSVADEATIARREGACLACEHLVEPTASLQKLMPAPAIRDEAGRRTGRKVCDLCGCQVAKKMRIPTESCPGRHPAMAGLTRWLEPAAPQGRSA